MHSLTPDIHNTNAHYFYSDALCMSSSETFWWMGKGFAHSCEEETELAEVVCVFLVFSSSLSFAYSEYLKLNVHPKILFASLFTHPHVISKLFYRYNENWGMSSSKMKNKQTNKKSPSFLNQYNSFVWGTVQNVSHYWLIIFHSSELLTFATRSIGMFTCTNFHQSEWIQSDLRYKFCLYKL